jgi:hypothetical protein
LPRQASVSTGITVPPPPSRNISYRNRGESRNNQYVITYEVTARPIRVLTTYAVRLFNLAIELIRITIAFLRDFFLSLTLPILKFLVPNFGRSRSVEVPSDPVIEQPDDTDEPEDEPESDDSTESKESEKLRSDDRLPK